MTYLMLTIEALLMLSTLSEATTLNRIILDNKRAEERYRKMNVSNIGHYRYQNKTVHSIFLSSTHKIFLSFFRLDTHKIFIKMSVR